jgi:hypothetical protein
MPERRHVDDPPPNRTRVWAPVWALIIAYAFIVAGLIVFLS